jgi:hypothetical protein
MAAHVRKIKKKTLSEGISLSSFSNIGDSMTSILNDAELSRKKCGRIMIATNTFSTMINNVRDIGIFTKPKSLFNTKCAQIELFVRETTRTLYGIDVLPIDAETAPLNTALSEEDFKKLYDSIRDHEVIHTIIHSCDILDPYKSYINNIDTLNGTFIETMPGTSFTPFADFDVKDAYMQTDDITRRKYLLTYIHKLHTLGKKLYLEYVTPDMNIERMVEVVRSAITQLRTMPELSQCDIAFDTIDKSIGLLRDNFSQYYVDFTISQHPASIFESFVADVAKHESDVTHPEGAEDVPSDVEQRNVRRRKMRQARLTQQFSKIIGFYQEHASKSSRKNPQAEMLMRHYNSLTDRLNVKNLSRENAPTPNAENK